QRHDRGSQRPSRLAGEPCRHGQATRSLADFGVDDARCGRVLEGGLVMGKAIRSYVHGVDTFNRWVGRFAMQLLFVMAAIMLYAIASRLFLGRPINWVMEMSQFLLSAYYL